MNITQKRIGFWALALILLFTSLSTAQSASATSTDDAGLFGLSKMWSLSAGLSASEDDAGTEVYFANLDPGKYKITNKGEGDVLVTETDIEGVAHRLKKGESIILQVPPHGIIHIRLAENSKSARGSFDKVG